MTTRAAAHTKQLHIVGADNVIFDGGNVSDEVLHLQPKGIDAALEVIGTSTLRDTARTLKPFGAVTVIGMPGGPQVLERFNLMVALPQAVRLASFPAQLPGSAALPLADSPLRSIVNDIAADQLPSHLQHVFAFDEVREWIESNRARGRLVVRV
ncbi:zinc-binding dehydrogenase [Burkholderia lata]|uniref:Alcohol dehydrogenase n=1 Tax=Burkholderia lata (strain ATCC 17760 / DSM 23089 / LMG 22485 / NCIMB 9086 / R18194 / 383) TaxID=482957 RepID=A0A6P2LWW4_BURL3|nr:zinc-binding dehydrogenase [Burkholderia lata]VWB76622.1 alcohol dehydrogenase [Burkholderia lata]